MDEWRIVFYEAVSGRYPVRDLLRDLDRPARKVIGEAIERLRLQNVRAREPLVKALGDKLWELRVDAEGDTYRIFYFAYIGKRIVLLHAFQKKTQQTPPRELDIAYRRMAEFLSRRHNDDET